MTLCCLGFWPVNWCPPETYGYSPKITNWLKSSRGLRIIYDIPLHYGMRLGCRAGEYNSKTSRQVKAKVRVEVRRESERNESRNKTLGKLAKFQKLFVVGSSNMVPSDPCLLLFIPLWNQSLSLEYMLDIGIKGLVKRLPQKWQDATFLIRLQKSVTSLFKLILNFLACTLWWSKLTCWRGPHGQELSTVSSQQLARSWRLLLSGHEERNPANNYMNFEMHCAPVNALPPWNDHSPVNTYPMEDLEVEDSAKVYPDFWPRNYEIINMWCFKPQVLG